MARKRLVRPAQLLAPVATPAAVPEFKPPFNSVWVLMDLPAVEKLIALGGNFRSINQSRISLYTDLMLTGRWVWEMEPWHVSVDGHFDQGQHRAWSTKAYLEAGGEPQWVEVRYDCPAEWADLLDSAQARTNAQRVTNLGHHQAGDIASVTLSLWQVAKEGVLGHLTSPPDLMRTVLGTKDAPRLCTEVIHEGVKLAHRVERSVKKNERGGITIPTLGAAIAMMLYEDDAAARIFVERMITSGEFAVRTTSDGPEAVMGIMRSLNHSNDADRSRSDRKQRVLTMMWITWRNPAITYATLNHRLLAAKEDALKSKTKVQWDKVRPEIQSVAIDLLDLS